MVNGPLPVDLHPTVDLPSFPVHEMALCEAIVGTVFQHAGDRRVSRVQLRIGHLRQVVPDALTFSWEVRTTGTELEGSVLDIESVPATVRCEACDAETTLDLPVMVCGSCTSRDVKVLTGEEFVLVSLEVADA